MLIGFNPFFNLHSNSRWEFDEIEYDWVNDIIVTETKNQEEEIVFLEKTFFFNMVIAMNPPQWTVHHILVRVARNKLHTQKSRQEQYRTVHQLKHRAFIPVE